MEQSLLETQPVGSQLAGPAPLRLSRPVIDLATLRQYKKEFNFFETSIILSDKMAQLLDVPRNARIIDPSAGLGALLKAVRKAIPFPVQLEYCEIQEEFVSHLAEYERVGSDFLAYNPGPIYDAVIMNPPYKNRSAEIHVDHAWDILKPGGKIVALVNKTAAAYLDDQYEGHVFEREYIIKGFAETSVDTVLFLIHKPLYAV